MSTMQRVLRGIVVTTLIASGGLLVPAHTAGAIETGGYPWADAELIRAATFDWGYQSCQPAMQAAKTCHAHTSTKLGKKYFQSDPWRYDVRNCTSYVAWRIAQELGISIGGWGDAKNWDTAAQKAGYSVDSSPSVGAIAQWESYYGHVAYVTSVNPDGSVNVDQYNKAGTGMFSRQSRVRATHYIHLPQSTARPAVAAAPEPSAVMQTTPSTVLQPVTTTAQPVVTQLASLNPTNDQAIPTTPGVSYLPALNPEKREVNMFAVAYQTTNSRKIEVSQTDYADGNTAWVTHWVTNQSVTTETPDFQLADSNADGKLDLYIIQKGKITVLDGAKQFAETKEDYSTPSIGAPSASYSLADYDGNGSLDLYSVSESSDSVNIVITDGSRQYSEQLAEWKSPKKLTANQKDRVLVADHDQDGKPDIYLLGTEVTVMRAETNFQESQTIPSKTSDALEPKV